MQQLSYEITIYVFRGQHRTFLNSNRFLASSLVRRSRVYLSTPSPESFSRVSYFCIAGDYKMEQTLFPIHVPYCNRMSAQPIKEITKTNSKVDQQGRSDK